MEEKSKEVQISDFDKENLPDKERKCSPTNNTFCDILLYGIGLLFISATISLCIK